MPGNPHMSCQIGVHRGMLLHYDEFRQSEREGRIAVKPA
jgi:hypothetical protein